MKKLVTFALILAPFAVISPQTLAASFEVTNGTTVTVLQTVNGGESGLIDQGGTLAASTAGGGGAANLFGVATATNNGLVTATGNTTYGFQSFGANSVLVNNGTMSSNGNNDDLILLYGDSNRATNNGTLATTNDLADGLVTNPGAANSILINNGTITTTGQGANGFYVVSANTVAINNGTITTQNFNSLGMISTGAGSSATNNGHITTTGSTSAAMQSRTTTSTLVNNGTLTTTGPTSDAMWSTSTNSIVTNNGTILNTGDGGIAIRATDVGNTLTNNGAVIVSGVASDGLNATTGNTIINRGLVTTNGTGDGIRGLGDTIAVSNYGRVIANGGNAIEATGNNDSVTLGYNSLTQGAIVFGGTNGALVYDVAGVGRAGSAIQVTGQVSGVHTTTIANAASLPEGARVVQGKGGAAIVTPDSFAGNDQMISQVLMQSGDLTLQRQQAALLGQNAGIPSGTRVASDTSRASDADPASGWGMREQNVAWAEGFGSYQERPQEGSTDVSRARAGGMLAGLDLPSSQGYQGGVFIGGFAGGVDIGDASYRSIDSQGGLAGAYAGHALGDVYVSGEMKAGMASNSSSRTISNTIATATYNSYFLNPSATLMRPYKLDALTLVPSMTVGYTFEYDGGYNESGSVAPQSVNGHSYNSVNGRAQVAAQFDDQEIGGGTLRPSVRVGVQDAVYLGSRSVGLSVLGSSLTVNPKGDDDYVDGIVGTNISYSINRSTDIYFDGEALLGLNKTGINNNVGATGLLGARYRF